jgi:hypothetical protein
MVKPAYLQGDLDCLCGVYSVVNGAKLVNSDLRGSKAWDLFYYCVKHIQKRKRLLRDLTGGVPGYDIKALLRNVLASKYEITVKRPFSRVPGIKLNPFLAEIRKFLEEDENRAVIVCFAAGWELPHWSVIKSAGKIQVSFCDSAGWSRISRRRLTTRKATKSKPFLFATKETYFVSNGS